MIYIALGNLFEGGFTVRVPCITGARKISGSDSISRIIKEIRALVISHNEILLILARYLTSQVVDGTVSWPASVSPRCNDHKEKQLTRSDHCRDHADDLFQSVWETLESSNYRILQGGPTIKQIQMHTNLKNE